jgi:hypothetical protein
MLAIPEMWAISIYCGGLHVQPEPVAETLVCVLLTL